MKLPENFQFSQSSLQDFVECRRRFYLRYIRNLAWPAAEAEPVMENEKHVQQGILFHRMIHQHILGIPTDRLSLMMEKGDQDLNSDLPRWWDNYLSFFPELPYIAENSSQLFPETSLSAPVGHFRLVAKFDLIVATPDGNLVIYDWKTARKHPKRSWLQNHMQTRVYQYLLALGSSRFSFGMQIKPEKIRMTYWFAEFPSEPESFSYSDRQFALDETNLNQTIVMIDHLADSNDENTFPLTLNEDHCRFCVYRSLCNRGLRPGTVNLITGIEDSSTGDNFDFDLDFEQIGEIEF